MSAPPLESSFFYRMATSLNKAWSDWFVALGVTQSGLGTMATQNANAVAITGGSMSGVTGPAYLASANVFTQQNTFSAGGIVLPTGTFTPTLVSSGGGVPTYSVQVGTYTVVGNRVLVNAAIAISAYGSLAAGNLTISGLPFTSDATSQNTASLAVVCDNLDATATTMVQAMVLASSSVITLYKFASGSRSALTKANTSATAIMRISGAYQV